MRVSLQAAYVLHTRHYRDTSLLVEIFTREHGRVSLVAKGARPSGAKRSRGGSQAALLQPFVPLLCSWSGRSSLRTSTGCEPRAPSLQLKGQRVYCGLYVNELMNRLLHHDDPHPELFDYYEHILEQLAQVDNFEWILRQFEFRLLEELGYGFDLARDGLSGEPVNDGQWYVYHNEYGLLEAVADTGSDVPRFAGADLLKIESEIYDDDSRRCAKRLMRAALATHLGGKPLKSRELFGVAS
jgi:DNA repair protein RecO (recombination protein O)